MNISKSEKKFWLELIDQYLKPIILNDTEKIVLQQELNTLRNKVLFNLFKFFIIILILITGMFSIFYD